MVDRSLVEPALASHDSQNPKGTVIERHGQRAFEILNVHEMRPFLMTMVSDHDHWMFITSNGALTAGRRNPDQALFPYYTQDKLEDMSSQSGSVSLFWTEHPDGGPVCWRPFLPGGWCRSPVVRHLRKSELGNWVELEEMREDLGLSFRVMWRPSRRYGFVRSAELRNVGKLTLGVRMLDGVQNLMCPGLSARFQNEFSNLGDAYKQAVAVAGGYLGIYWLSSIPTDLAVPMEALRASAVWRLGLEDGRVSVCPREIERFSAGHRLEESRASRGLRGAYLTEQGVLLEPGQSVAWMLCMDTGLDACMIESLQNRLEERSVSISEVEADCRRTERSLESMIAGCDGLEATGDARWGMRHLSNTLFNVMRGGTFPNGYRFPAGDLAATVAGFNRPAGEEVRRYEEEHGPLDAHLVWGKLPASLGTDAVRLVREYLPLSFSRRHGDPSRPWNRFSIEVEDPDGRPRYSYQGNWRDIFQNWEALVQAYPRYVFPTVYRFLNASTADGYNPYRLTKEGFEWETIDPNDPWANIGYWGDHQIVYLLRLLETAERFFPGRLVENLETRQFVYAEVPYRISSFRQMLADPRNTIHYDTEKAKAIEARVKAVGADGKLLHDREGRLLHVSLLEKLLNPILAKLSNFVPGGGIWMNTQRPEWNDANNALVGYGVSVVTACYLLRYLHFVEGLLGAAKLPDGVGLSRPLVELLRAQSKLLEEEPVTDSDLVRFKAMEALGEAGARYRETAYESGLSDDQEKVELRELAQFLRRAGRHLDATLAANRRTDSLFHSYNLLELRDGSVALRRLQLMLEGQVAALSSHALKDDDAVALLQVLRASELYRSDQHSYLLYPDHVLPGFLEKNIFTGSDLAGFEPLLRVAEGGDQTVLVKWSQGRFSFNGDLCNRGELMSRLRKLEEREAAWTREHSDRLAGFYDQAFGHDTFTGRSGTFFAYEGLGSIYWHMVSKLALAVQERAIVARNRGDDKAFAALTAYYREIKDGLGVHKPVAVHGAIPTDAYSHTPSHAGAQQPGMTGQVKEDILCRRNELGIRIEEGRIRFDPSLLKPEEWSREAGLFRTIGVDGSELEMQVPQNGLAFSICQVPVLYQAGYDEERMEILYADGGRKQLDGLVLPAADSLSMFDREGRIVGLRVYLPECKA